MFVKYEHLAGYYALRLSQAQTDPSPQCNPLYKLLLTVGHKTSGCDCLIECNDLQEFITS